MATITGRFTLELYRIQNVNAWSNCCLLNVYSEVPRETSIRGTGSQVNTYDFFKQLIALSHRNTRRNSLYQFLYVFSTASFKEAYVTTKETSDTILAHLSENDLRATAFAYPDVGANYQIDFFERHRNGLYVSRGTTKNVPWIMTKEIEDILHDNDQPWTYNYVIIMRGPDPLVYTTRAYIAHNVKLYLRDRDYTVV